jgi:hypothetical protein
VPVGLLAPRCGTPDAPEYLRKIPEMGTPRIHVAHMRKRLARAALEAALVVALLLPWAAILAWLFWRDTLR